jgi:3-dehydroquinate synthetase
MAEVIKHSLIADSDLLDKIETGQWKRESGDLQPPLPELQILVSQAIQVKINIVQADPFEQGPRAVLNLGHTFAHAIEQVSGNAIRHGEAVAMGLVAAANLSARLGHCPAALQERIESVLDRVGLPHRIAATLEPQRLLAAMTRDKKKTGGRLRFVLLRSLGDVFVTDSVPRSAVLETLKELTASTGG